MGRLRVKNWNEHQHYKGRHPPWIKLHKKLLDDFEFNRLQLASRALAPMLWLMASESEDGTVSDDPSEIAFRLRLQVKEVAHGLQPLIDSGFFVPIASSKQDASTPLATCLSRDRDRDREDQKQHARSDEKAIASAPAAPDSPFVAFVRSEWADLKDPADIERRAGEAFPGVDLLAEARKARGWEASDPKRRKHNHGRFLWGWFGRAQDSASRAGSKGAVTPISFAERDRQAEELAKRDANAKALRVRELQRKEQEQREQVLRDEEAYQKKNLAMSQEYFKR